MKQNPKTLFVVEDDSILRAVLIEKLSKSGYLVEGAEDGVIAMQKLQDGLRPDVMLLDIIMPHKNGMEVMEEMNKDPELKKIPIIIISNSGQPVEVERAKALGAKDFLIKAVFDPSEVLGKVQILLGERVAPTSGSVDTGEINIDLNQDISDRKKVDTTDFGDSSGKGVLVVEDDKFLRDLFVRKLSSVGFQVEYGVDAKNAFEVLKRFKPDIILLDLILPDIDGFEILTRLKHDEHFATIPVLILSNLGQQEDIDRAMSLGAEGFMVKASFNLEEIADRIHEVLSTRK